MNALDAALELLVPRQTPVVHVHGDRPASGTAIPLLARGEQLVLIDGRRLSARRLRRLAQDAGLVVDRELVVLPGLSAPAFVVEDGVESMGWFCNAFATVPPGRAQGSFLITAATRLARHRPLVGWLGRLVPGRMVIARRP
ncbi:MAG TPA: hypothetical protein VFP73_01340 [Terrabacter sp.]|nr:hypothetical protein [Terrabacter sp.]